MPKSGSRPPAVTLRPITSVSRANAAERIVEDLRGIIARGLIVKGARLPTERDLAATYGVSSSTVREAVRALAVMGLVEVRHGSGTYVVQDTSSLVNAALATAMQMEGVEVSELIGLLALINEQAATLAVRRAKAEDIAALSHANANIISGGSSREILDGVVAFLTALIASSHEPLLSFFGRFLIQLLDRIESDLFPPDVEFWRELTGRVQEERTALIFAIETHDTEAATAAVRDYHRYALETLGQGTRARLSDERLAGVVSALISGH